MTKIKVGDFTRPDLYYASLKFKQPAKGKEITKDGRRTENSSFYGRFAVGH
jgi:hypothetical protein